MAEELERRHLNKQLIEDMSSIKTQLAVMGEKTNKIEILLEKFSKIMFGNGKVGLVTQVKINAENIKEYIATRKFTINRAFE